MIIRETAGEKSLQASLDTTRHDPMEIAEALLEDTLEQVLICINNHYHLIDENEFCVVRITATDPLIHNLRRYKYYAWPYLPKPRPNQTVFLYEKQKDTIKLLWALPPAHTMASVSSLLYVAKPWRRTKVWCDAFYMGNFWETIRKMSDIDLLSESEYLELHRKELIEAGCKEGGPTAPNTADLFDVAIKKIEDSCNALPNQD